MSHISIFLPSFLSGSAMSFRKKSSQDDTQKQDVICVNEPLDICWFENVGEITSIMFWEWQSEENFQFIYLYKEGLWLLGKNNIVNAAWRNWIRKSGEAATRQKAVKWNKGCRSPYRK